MAKQNVDKSFLNGMVEISPGVWQKAKTTLQPREIVSHSQTQFAKTYKETGKAESNITWVNGLSIHKEHKITGHPIVNTPKHPPIIVFEIDPIGAPRLTRRDAIFTDPNHIDPKKRQRPAVTRYWIYKRQLEAIATGSKFTMPESHFHIFCYMEMPQSWSKKKKQESVGYPHKQRPDSDNILKGIQDALCSEDSYIFDANDSLSSISRLQMQGKA